MNFSNDFSKNQRTFFIRTVITRIKKLVLLELGSTLNMRDFIEEDERVGIGKYNNKRC